MDIALNLILQIPVYGHKVLGEKEEYNPSSPASLCSFKSFFRVGFGFFLVVHDFSPLCSLLTAQAPRDPSYEEPAKENWGPWSSHGRGTYLGQQIHRTQHCGAGTAVGPAGPAGDEDAAQPGAADPSPVLPGPRLVWSVWLGVGGQTGATAAHACSQPCMVCAGVSCAQNNGCSELEHPHHIPVPFRGMKWAVLEQLLLVMSKGGMLVEWFYSVE